MPASAHLLPPTRPPTTIPPLYLPLTNPMMPWPLATLIPSTRKAHKMTSPLQTTPPPNQYSLNAPITVPATSKELTATMGMPNLPSTRLNCLSVALDHPLPDRRLNCLLAKWAGNPYVMSHAGYHMSRLASPLKQLAAALQIRAHFSLGPQLPKGPHICD